MVVIWFGCWWFEGGISVVMVIWFGCWWCGGGVSVVMVMWFGVLVVGVNKRFLALDLHEKIFAVRTLFQ